MKTIPTINSAIMEDMECSIINALVNLKVCVSLDYYALFTSSYSNMLCNVAWKE